MERKSLRFKLPLAKITPWIILIAMLAIYALNVAVSSYRVAAWLGPIWCVVLVVAYEITQRFK